MDGTYVSPVVRPKRTLLERAFEQVADLPALDFVERPVGVTGNGNAQRAVSRSVRARVPSGSAPTATITPSRTAASARRAGPPVPSTSEALRTRRSTSIYAPGPRAACRWAAHKSSPSDLHAPMSAAPIAPTISSVTRQRGPEVLMAPMGQPSSPQNAAATQTVPISGAAEQAARELAVKQSIPRRGLAEDLAGTFVYLASSDSDFVTGQVVVVDGGWVNVNY